MIISSYTDAMTLEELKNDWPSVKASKLATNTPALSDNNTGVLKIPGDGIIFPASVFPYPGGCGTW